MIYLLRTIESHDVGSVEHRDKEFYGAEITIGRATDQDIQLMEPEVALRHAVIQLRGDGQALIRAAGSTLPLSVNDKVVRSASIQPGDTVLVGDSVLGVFKPPEGFDFALTLKRGEVETDEDKAPPPGSQYVTTLAAAGLRKRPAAWGLFLLVLVAFLVVPVSGLFDQRVQAFLRSTPAVPDDGVWSPGALIPAHNIPELSEHCNVCHVKPFVRVQDEQCTTCHDEMLDHVVSSG